MLTAPWSIGCARLRDEYFLWQKGRELELIEDQLIFAPIFPLMLNL
jgi:hypothetical protein